jgi:hypothetical protein
MTRSCLNCNEPIPEEADHCPQCLAIAPGAISLVNENTQSDEIDQTDSPMLSCGLSVFLLVVAAILLFALLAGIIGLTGFRVN